MLTDVGALSRARVDGDNNSAFEAECKCRGTVLDLDLAVRVGVVIGV